MIAWLCRNGRPRTGAVLMRLERHGWKLELPDPDAGAQTELWASTRFADVGPRERQPSPFRGESVTRCAGHPSTGTARRRCCR
jgi:hypothetical protein